MRFFNAFNSLAASSYKNKILAFAVVGWLWVAHSFVYSQPGNAQNTANDPRHETLSQRVVSVLFDQNIQALPLPPLNGWSVTVNGIPVTLNSLAVLGNRVLITFDASPAHAGQPFIIPGDVLRVSYDAAAAGSNTLTATAGTPEINSFANFQSKNNWVFSCASDLVFFQQGLIPAASRDICAPVVMNFHQWQYKLSLRFRNSSSFVLANIFYQINWGDAVVQNFNPYISESTGTANPTFIENTGFDGTNPGIILTSRATHNYPATTTPAPNICSWDLSLTPFVSGVASCPSIAQTTIFPTYDTDNANSGALNLQPAVANSHRVCLGTNVNMRFSDLTLLNCRLAVEATVPNDLTRWIRIVYGSQNLATNIPDVRVGGTPVTANNAAGTLLFPGGYFPTGPGGIGVPDFNGVIELATPVTAATATTFMQLITTLATTFHVVGDRFFVRLDYWDVCNPYNPISPDANRVSIENYIEVIDKPASPVAANKEFCNSQDLSSAPGGCPAACTTCFEVTAASVTGSTEIKWYNTLADANADVNAIGSTYGTNCRFLRPENRTGGLAAMATAGVYSVFVRHRTGAAPPNNCLSDPIPVTITRRSALSPPGIISPLTSDVCDGSLNVPYSLPDPPPAVAFGGATEYSWTFSGGAGATVDPPGTTQNITADFTIGGSFTTTTRTLNAITQFTTNATTGGRCPTTASTRTVTIYGPSVGGTASGGGNYCEGTDASDINLSGQRGSVVRWEVNINSGGFVDAGVGSVTTFDPGILPAGNYVYRAVVANGPCVSQNSTTTTINVFVNPATANAGPDQFLCIAPPLDATLAGSNPAPGTGTWTRVSGPGAAPTFTPNANTPNAVVRVFANGIHTFRWTVINGTCTSFDDVVIDFGTTPPASNAGADQDVCGLSATLNGNDPTFATGTWSQTAGPGISSFVPNANTRNAVVTVTVPGTYTYRWRLTSGTCAASDDFVDIIFRDPPTVAAPADFTHCLNNPPTAPFFVPLSGTFGGGASQARWEVVTGTGIFSSSGAAVGVFDNTSPATDTYQPSAGDFTAGSVTLRLITNDPVGACAAVNDPLVITFDRLPSAAAAGPDFATCDPTANLAATPANNGGTGTWSIGNALYYQTFTYPNGTGLSGPNPHPLSFTHPTDGWTITAPNTNTLLENNAATGDYMRVESGVMQAHDVNAELIWRSPSINITALPNVTISIQLAEFGPMTGTDYIRAYYRINGGAEVLIGQIVGNGVDGAFNTFNVSGLSGITLEVVVRVLNVNANQIHRFDNIFVSSAGASLPLIANINSPTSAVSNIPVGNTTFTWTVTSALGVCSSSNDQVVITRHASPVNNNQTPALCENTPGAGVATVSLAFLTSLNDAITGIPGSVGRTVQFFTDAARTVPYPASANLSNGEIVYTRVTQTNFVPNCTTNGIVTFTVRTRPAAINQNPEFCEDLPVGSNTRTGINLTTFDNAVKNSVAANTVAWFTDVATTIPVPVPTNVTANNGTSFFARITDVFGCTNVAEVEITVNSRPGPNPIIGATNVCVDPTAINLYQVTTINAGSTYAWTIPDPPFDRFAGGGVNDFFVLLAFPVVVSPGQDMSFIETNAKGCVGLPNVKNITVESSPPPIVINGPTAVCENQTGVVYDVPNLANTTYAWTVPVGSSIIAGQGTNQITINFGIVGGLIEVTPTTTTGCAGNPTNLGVAINPRPSLNPLSNTVCSDTQAGITLAGPGAVTFNITNVSVPPGLSPASRPLINGALSGEIFGDIWTNTTGGNLTVQYTVVPVSLANCTGTAQIVNLTIRPEPVLAPNLNDIICSGTESVSIVLSVAAGSSTADQFEITSINTNGLTAVAGNPTTGIFTASVLLDDRWENTTGAPVVVEYFVRPINSVTGCIGDPPIPVMVTVNPEPVVSSPTSETICSGTSPTITLTSTIPGSTFTWIVKSITGLITGTANGSGANITNILVNNGVVPGTVTYEVKAQTPVALGQCESDPVDVTITVDPAPTGNNINQTVCSDVPGGSTFFIDLTTLQPAINSGGGITFSWFQDLALTIPIAVPTAYTLTNGVPVFARVDNGQCIKVAQVLFVINPRPSVTSAITSNFNGFNVSCNGASDGQITATPSNGVAPYQFSIDGGSTFFGSPIFNGLSAAGSPYIVRVRDANNCINNSAPLTLTNPPAVSGVAAITSNFNGRHVSCNTATDGQVTVTPAGGTGTYTFRLLEIPSNTTGDASGIYTGLGAGTYTFIVRDNNNCQFTTNTVTIVEPTPVTAAASLTAPVTCNGNNDGEITVIGGGGTLIGPNYQFTLNQPPGTVNATGIFTGLAAGTYTVTVRDDNNCTRVSNSVIVTQPSVLTVFSSVTSNYNGAKISCAGANDAQVTAFPNGGNGGYTFSLVQNPGNLTGNMDGSYEGLGPGNYSITVMDIAGCSITSALVNVAEPLPVGSSALVTGQISCNGGSNGQITVSGTGGTGAYTFTQINPPGPSNGSGIFSGLANGTYDFQVRDLNNCASMVQITLNQPAPVTALVAVTSNYNGSQVSCNGASDGVITVTGSGGTGVIQYVFDQFVFTNTTGQFSGVFTGVPAGGPYTFTVRDANNCTFVTAPVNVTQPTPVTGSGVVTSNYNGQHITCVGATNGQITVTPAGGTGAHTFKLDQAPTNTSGDASGIYTGVGAGVYTVTIRDANSCFVVTAPITVAPPPALTASMAVTSNYNGRQISCNGASDGILTVTAGGGVPAYSYLLIEIPGNVTGAATGIFTGVPAGTYTVLVTDLNSCTRVTSPVTVSEPAVLNANSTVTSNYNGQQISCTGASDGTIRVTQTGGTPGYTYSFVEIPGNVTGAATGIFTGIPAGTYTFIVRDVNLCQFTTAPITITPPPAVTANAAVTSNYNGSQVSCNGASDGVISVTGGGGTGILQYTFNQIPANTTGQLSGIFIGVPAGVGYTFTVRDINNCQTTSAPITVTQPTPVTGSAVVTSNYNGQQIRCVGSTDGIITVTPAGGTGTYSFKLDQAPTNTSGDLSGIYTGLGAGAYTVTIRDQNSCFVVTAPITITPPPALNASMSVTSNYNGSQISCNGASDAVLTVNAIGGVPAYSYLLVEIPGNVTGAASGVFTGIPPGTYTVLVTDQNGCQRTTAPVSVTQPAVLVPSSSITSNYNGQHVSCNGASDGIIRVTQTGGTAAYSYQFIEIPGNVSGAASGIFTGIPAGTYTFRVTDVNNCMAVTVPITVNQPPAITASASITSNYNGQNVSCNGAGDGIVTVTSAGGTGSPIYVFDQFAVANQTGRFSGVFTSVQAGPNYTFTVTDVNGCSVVTAPITVTQPVALTGVGAATSNFNGFNISCFNQTNGQLTITFGGGTAPLNFTLLENPGNTSGQLTGVFDNLRAGTYRVRIQDVNGCLLTTAPVTITQPADLSIAIAITSNYNGFAVSCFGASDGQISVTASAGGAGGYTFELFKGGAPTGNVTGQLSGIFTGLNSGLYDINITDVNTCVKKSLPVVIVDPLPLFEGILGFNQNICLGQNAPVPFIELAPAFGSIGNYVYQWQESTDGIVFSNILGATSATFTAPPTLVVKTYYKRIITSGCQTLESNVVSVTVNSIPTATLAPSHTPVCEGEFFILNFNFSNGTAPYFFDYNNGTVFVTDRIGADVTPVPVINYMNTTTYTLTRVRDFNGCLATVLPPPVTVPVSKINPNFVILSPPAQCSGSDFTFQWTVDPDIDYTWIWSDGNQDVIPANSRPNGVNTIIHNFVSFNTSTNTNFPVILSAVNNIAGCGPKQSNQAVTIFPNILINMFPNKNEMCSGDQVSIVNPTLGGNSHSWQVIRQSDNAVVDSRGPFVTASNQTFTITNTTALNPNVYNIVYSVSNGSCNAQQTIPVTVYREIIAGFNEGVVPPFVGGNATVTYTNTSSPIDVANFSYDWEFGLAATPLTASGVGPFTVDYSSPGLKTVRLTTINTVALGNGVSCSSIAEKNISILLPPLVAGFTYTPQNACFPTQIRILTNTATGNQFQWIVVDQAGRTVGTSTVPLPIFDIVNPGTYTIFLTTTNTITGQTAFADNSGTGPNAMPGAVPINVYNLPLASFQARPTTLFVPNTELVTFNFSTPSAPPADSVNFWWNFGDTNNILKQNFGDRDPTYFYPVEGLYTVTMVMREVRGNVVCVDTVTQLITAREGGQVKVPNAFTPDPTGPNGGIPSSGAAVNDVFLPLVKGINLNEPGTFLMQIFDRWGTMIFESRNEPGAPVPIRGWDGYDRNQRLLPAGVYVFKLVLRLSDGQQVTQVGDVTLIR